MLLQVRSPVAGHSLAVSDVPDPVFAGGLVGPGVAITPRAGHQASVAPISGRLTKLLPHAYLIVDEAGRGVLVHLGVDTVHMQGEGFVLLASENDQVAAGDRIVEWDPDRVRQAGHSPVCAVVMLDCDPATVTAQAVGVEVEFEQLLFEVDC